MVLNSGSLFHMFIQLARVSGAFSSLSNPALSFSLVGVALIVSPYSLLSSLRALPLGPSTCRLTQIIKIAHAQKYNFIRAFLLRLSSHPFPQLRIRLSNPLERSGEIGFNVLKTLTRKNNLRYLDLYCSHYSLWSNCPSLSPSHIHRITIHVIVKELNQLFLW